ncbi:hypothetical protein [Burkholderia cepacia]|uniref:hypothetical protein n=1 Tax=Burkholderia cepacia TaxID=292 RepID=UPI00075F9A17|nr:hypothetical protein [Burkholderia cepacia]KWC80575.1 hypothetical protein WL56_21675 [Burkholderia cepacia]
MSEPSIEKPIYEPVQQRDGSGYFVRIRWSDGFEDRIDGFSDEAEAQEWIEKNGAHWHEWASHRVQSKR